MVPSRSLFVLHIAVFCTSVTAALFCRDPFSDYVVSVNGTACVYWMNLNTLKPGSNVHDGDNEYNVFYEDLVQFYPEGEVVFGKGYWRNGNGMFDVYYVACRASANETINQKLVGVHMEEHLLKQYILTSFINCIPENLSEHRFECYSGKTTENGEYVRELRTAHCRNRNGVYEPIENGLDVCTFEFDISSSYELDVGQPSLTRNARNYEMDKLDRRPEELCKLHREGITNRVGLENGQCLRRVGPYNYDILCCFYGNNNDFYKDIPETLSSTSDLSNEELISSSGIKSFCAVTDNVTHTFDYSKKRPSDDWETSPVRKTHLRWSDFIDEHFKQICMTTAKYKFSGRKTEVAREVYATATHPADCYDSKSMKLQCETVYGNEEDAVICPFDARSEINEMKFSCCCRGHFCNHKPTNDLFARKRQPTRLPRMERLCPLPLDLDFPEFIIDRCVQSWDSVSMLEINDASREAQSLFTYKDNKVSDKNLRLCLFAVYNLTLAVDEYVKKCPNNPPGFIERRRAGIPWITVLSVRSRKDTAYIASFVDTASEKTKNKLSGRCYEHSEANATVPFAGRAVHQNKESTYCYMRLHEDVDGDMKTTMGSYNSSTSLSLFDEFKNFTCNLDLYRKEICYYDSTIRATLCCTRGKESNGEDLWKSAIRLHLNRTTVNIQEWSERKQISCRDENGFLKSCDTNPARRGAIGCYMERSTHILDFAVSDCLEQNDVNNLESRGRALCEYELLHNKGNVAFCSFDKEADSIYCCCRHDEACQKLRSTYSSVTYT